MDLDVSGRNDNAIFGANGIAIFGINKNDGEWTKMFPTKSWL